MICCVTGHRPEGFPFTPDDKESYLQYKRSLDAAVRELLEQGYRHFITGMAEGVDTDFALAVLTRKKNYENVKLEAALPYPRSRGTQSLRNTVLAECDCETMVSEKYFDGCMQKRNCYMVDKADLVLAVWNGKKKGGTWNTISYARKKNKPIRYIMLKAPDEREPEQMRLF